MYILKCFLLSFQQLLYVFLCYVFLCFIAVKTQYNGQASSSVGEGGFEFRPVLELWHKKASLQQLITSVVASWGLNAMTRIDVHILQFCCVPPYMIGNLPLEPVVPIASTLRWHVCSVTMNSKISGNRRMANLHVFLGSLYISACYLHCCTFC